MKYKNWLILSSLVWGFSFCPQEDITLQIKKEIEIQANQYRVKNKDTELLVSQCLDKAALQQAEYLLDKKELSHFQEKKETKTPTDRVNLLQCPNKIVLENVAYFEYDTIPNAKESAKLIMQLWIKSKGHRNNLLSDFSKQMGTSVTIDTKNKRVIALQVFTD